MTIPSSNRWGIALDDGPIHERAGIAFVGVADKILMVAGRLPSELPFLAGRESTSATTAKSARFDHVANLVGRHSSQKLDERLVATPGDVLFDLRRIDQAAIGQDPSRLRSEERMLIQIGDIRPGFVIRIAMLTEHHLFGNRSTQRLVEQHGHAGRGDLLERHASLAGQLNVYQRLQRAQADATYLDYVGLDFVVVQILMDGGKRRFGASPQSARSCADKDRRARDTIASEFCKPLLAMLASRLICIAVAIDDPREHFEAGRAGLRIRLVRCRHFATPFFGRSRLILSTIFVVTPA